MRIAGRLGSIEMAMLLACLVVCAGAAAANTWPVSEGTCLAGVPWAEEGRTGCSLMAPSISDMGTPIVVLTGAGERYIYVVEKSYEGGGGYPGGGDGIVQLSNGGAGDPPQFVSCVSELRTPNCSQIPDASAIHQAQSAVLSPNGKYLYLASFAGIASSRSTAPVSLNTKNVWDSKAARAKKYIAPSPRGEPYSWRWPMTATICT
jgi:hypothetical protein